jgi:uncharacterized protein (DUF488 family)
MITVYTIGHSTRTIKSFINILKSHEIETFIDVRTIAASRHNPQYNEEQLSKSISVEGIGYIHCKGLGGLRHITKNSINTAWRNISFRGYADYMQTTQFKENIERLIKVAGEKHTVIMCAEAVPWRCHRSLIGDALPRCRKPPAPAGGFLPIAGCRVLERSLRLLPEGLH